MGGSQPIITATIEHVLTPKQEERQLRKKTRAEIRGSKLRTKAGKKEMHQNGRMARKELRKTAVAQQLPPTFLGRTAYHAGSVRDLVEVVAAIGVAAVAIRRTWQELQIRHRPEEAHNQGTESNTQDLTS